MSQKENQQRQNQHQEKPQDQQPNNQPLINQDSDYASHDQNIQMLSPQKNDNK